MEEGRVGEAAQHGAFGIVEKGDLERSEKEELRPSAAPGPLRDRSGDKKDRRDPLRDMFKNRKICINPEIFCEPLRAVLWSR